MKINIIVPSTVLGGGVRVIFLYSNYLATKGHDVVVYVPILAYTNKRGIPNIKTSIANTFKRGTKVKWFDCKFRVKLAFVIKDSFIRDADITMASAWFTAPDVYDLASSKGKKVYFIQDYEVWNQKEEVVDSTYKLNMNRIVITNALKELLMNKFKVESIVIHNGNANDEYYHGEKIINSKKCIIMLCNLAEYKGGRNGIRILERLHEKYGIRIILFGISNPNDLPVYFEFYERPSREMLMSLFQQADICLFPSLQEAWGLTATEAMANKCAVVGNNTGVLKEMCIDGKDALIAGNFDSSSLELKIEKLINDDKLLNEIQNNGYKLAKTLSWEVAYEKFEKFLYEITNESTK